MASRLDGPAAVDRRHLYTYEPLLQATDHVRLLILQPGSFTDTLKGTLQAFSIRHLPPYEAISYCWGDSSAANHSQSVQLDGKVLLITPNAAETLLYSRSCEVSIAIWLDQVCINQEDVDECSQQVKLMNSVYEKATRVMVHLGSAFPGADILFDFMHAAEHEASRSSTLCKRRRRKPLPNASPLQAVTRPDRLLSCSTMTLLQRHEHHVHEFRKALFELLALPWFERMWVIQEASLAQNLVVRLGQYSATWDGLYGVVADLPYHDSKKLGLLPSSMTTGLRTVFAIQLVINELRRPVTWTEIVGELRSTPQHLHEFSINSLFRRWSRLQSRRHRIPILHLLREFRHQASTEKSDKLIGMLGLMSPDLVLDGYLSRLPHMGNIITCSWFFAIMHISDTGTLDILSASCHQAVAHEGLPLWCPDWSQEAPTCDTKYFHEPYTSPPHHAGTQERARYGYFDFFKGCALVIEGFQVDEVESVVEDDIHIQNYADPTHDTWFTWTLFGMQQHHSNPYGSVEGQWDAYWRTLIYNYGGRGKFASTSLGDDIKPFFSGVIDTNSKSARDILKSRLVFKHRKLYRTKRGYLGNGCCDVRAADKIFVSYGGRFPLIVRPDPDKLIVGAMAVTHDSWDKDDIPPTFVGHRLIGGDTYVHGLGEGQGFQTAAEEKLETELLCLV